MRRFLLKLLRRRTLQSDLEAELAFHREMSQQHQNPVPLGNIAVLKEQGFDLWRFNFPENLARDLVYAARGLRRHPGLSSPLCSRWASVLASTRPSSRSACNSCSAILPSATLILWST